ncbi:hypothetical protein LWI29_008912 [Acer saccharum]|uniref:Midasin n=1 Tax=Acer saccharum TaxID=4024 RepID=A0AA39RPD9_ACESA|nr:hypothetical protein LWI29_008912 [Acer saccharum]
MNLMAPRKDVFAAGMPDGQAPNPEFAMQPSVIPFRWISWLLTPQVVGNSLINLELNCQQKPSTVQKTQANPYRNVGDALEEWKERVNMSVDLQADNTETQDGVEDENADEYKNYLNLCKLSKLSVSDNEHRNPLELGVSDDLRDDASALWRRYELQTTRLSQELAEQLRLVMEPTLASKLQGTIRLLIPYIASHYRKDKIWLRRTKANKRDYQVVIAVDDSHSMSKSGCGDVAIETLVIVCGAMAQLEMGNLSVASFGKKGNSDHYMI